MTIWFIQPADLQESEPAREFVGDDYGGIPASVILVDAEPGRGPSLHKHAYAKLFFVIDGEATFTDRGRRTRRAWRRGRHRLTRPAPRLPQLRCRVASSDRTST
jgi:hypothetical protein